MISGVHHAGQILHLFTADEPVWGAANVGRSIGVSRSHAHRLLSTLAEVGLLSRAGPGGRFRLSWTWLEHANVIRTSDPLISSGVPIMRKLWQSYGLESRLAVWRDGAVVSFSPDAAPPVTRHGVSDWRVLRLVLMAGLPDDELAALLAPVPSSADLPSPDEVAQAVRQVRSGGLLVSSEPDGEARWLAAPIMDHENIVAALGVYALGALCPDGQSAITVAKKASALLTMRLRQGSE